METITLAAINVYPLKSAAGLAVAAARVGRRGLAGDRHWMVVDSQGSFTTQRTHHRLALLSVAEAPGGLLLSAPGMPALRVGAPPPGAPTVRVRIWDDECRAASAGDEAARWLSTFLGVPCGLVHMPEGTRRPVKPLDGVGPAELSFADAFPVLLISEASLDDLNRRLPVPVPMDRFRPNLVVRGCGPYAEDNWREVRIRDVTFHVVKPCTRCIATTVDQATGVSGREPLATLATYRRIGNGVVFGQNLVHEGAGEIQVGDPVTVLDRS